MCNHVGTLRVEVQTPFNIQKKVIEPHRPYTLMIVKSMTFTDSLYI